jgi:RNA polymerase sigma factor (sigma-70 family)
LPANTSTARERGHHEEWLDQLRARFLAIAARRVPRATAEDLVQEALVIVVEKGAAAGPGAMLEDEPSLAWCFQVLRNTIGNYYQRERTRRRASDPTSQAHHQLQDAARGRPEPTPLESLESGETARLLHEALDVLGAESETCGRYLRGIVDGDKPAAIAQREGLQEAVLYRRIYRCRERLRSILHSRGVLV